jgi:hypothetical protein
VGGFDEQHGIHYDGDYSAAYFSQGLPLILPIPNTLVLHPRNRSQGYGDPSVGLWKDVKAAFEKKYGERPGGLWRDKGCPK